MGTEGHNKGNFTDSKQRKWSAKTKKKKWIAKVEKEKGKGKIHQIDWKTANILIVVPATIGRDIHNNF